MVKVYSRFKNYENVSWGISTEYNRRISNSSAQETKRSNHRKCIFVYAKRDWEAESYKQVDNPITDSRTRELKRYMFGNATEASVDSQGRIVIPGNLREYAGIGKKVTVIGAGDHIEFWDTETWATYLAKISKELAA
jgi:MraZ protein